jgi:hypothetical protein
MEAGLLQFVAPLGFDEGNHPWDWVLLLRNREGLNVPPLVLWRLASGEFIPE